MLKLLLAEGQYMGHGPWAGKAMRWQIGEDLLIHFPELQTTQPVVSGAQRFHGNKTMTFRPGQFPRHWVTSMTNMQQPL